MTTPNSFTQCPTFSELYAASLPQAAGNTALINQTITEINTKFLSHLIRVLNTFVDQDGNTCCGKHLSCFTGN